MKACSSLVFQEFDSPIPVVEPPLPKNAPGYAVLFPMDDQVYCRSSLRATPARTRRAAAV